MEQAARKQQAAQAALEFIKPGMTLGVGTGSTVNYFIDELIRYRDDLAAIVASSRATEARLRARGLTVSELEDVGDPDLYVDGADEANKHFHLIKGGGGALTREKIVAAVARTFVCIADGSKLVDTLGRFPLPVEVIPMARSQVARELATLGGNPVLRPGFTTDNGNVIIDVHGLAITDPVGLEARINQITGVVTNGLFARRPANVLLLGTSEGVIVHT